MTERYHEVIRPLKEMTFSALKIGERALDRLLVGRSQPTPKHIQDLGKTVCQARNVQLVIQGFPHIERTDVAQLSETTNRWTDQGEYIERED